MGHHTKILRELETAYHLNINPKNGQVKSWSKHQGFTTIGSEIFTAPGSDLIIRQTWLDRAQANINREAAADQQFC